MVRGLCYSSSYQFLGAFAVLRKTTVSSIPVRPSSRNNLALTVRIFLKFGS